MSRQRRTIRARQRYALSHPVPYHAGQIPSLDKDASELVRQRRTTLVVVEVVPGVWVWQASLSYQRDSLGPLPLSVWSADHVRKADQELRSLLQDVGDAYVLGIRPSQHPVPTAWDKAGLSPWSVAGVDAGHDAPQNLGQLMPQTTDTMVAMHLWKSVSAEDRAQIFPHSEG